MSYYFAEGQTRPNRLTSKKDKTYHATYAKFCLSTLSNHLYRSYINKCLINWSFFKGGDGQWIFEEDTEGFFLDESGDIRNRIKWTKNVIKPMVQQYVGNAIRLAYDAKAECVSDFVINKREEDLKRLKGFEQVAKTFPFFRDIIKDRVPIGDSEMETEEIFMNSFVENYTQDINNLLEYMAQDIDMDELKVQIARNLSICGLGIFKGYEANGSYRADAVNPLNFGWDMSARKPDLSDAEYMFEWYYMDAPSLYERYPNITNENRLAIERFNESSVRGIHKFINGVYTITGNKIPTYEVYWKDTEKREYGWVLDEFGYPYYTSINNGNSKYTDKDLIEPPSDKHKERMGDKKKETIYDDILRYCILIPQEEIGSGGEDIILEYGIVPYQEKELRDPAYVKFPYKCYTWVYDRGEILTPLDDTIDPQRFLNRTLSVVESHMSNMRGSGTVIAKDAVDDNEAETMRNINASKPIFVDTARTGSVQNSIGQYGTNLGGDTLQMFQAIREIQMGIQDVTGVNEAMTGTQGGSDMLVGVIDAQIQRGSLVQEPFYWALTSILGQAYQHMATTGKHIYIDNPRRLAMMAGDLGSERIIVTQDHLLQDYRIFINRSETKDQGIQAGNQLLFTLLQAGMIDDIRFSNLFGRANSTQIAVALREFAKEKSQAQNMGDKVQAKRSEQEGQAQQQMMDMAGKQQAEASNMQQVNDQLAHERELEQIAAKNEGKVPPMG